MQHRSVMGTIGGMLAIFLIFAAPAAAQFEDCEVCDDSDWTKTVCVEADWTQMGSTNCTPPDGEVGPCLAQILNCWGSGPEFASALDFRPDGTFQQAAMEDANGSTVGRYERAAVEELGLSPNARIMERNCKGLILKRFYGLLTARALTAESDLIVI